MKQAPKYGAKERTRETDMNTTTTTSSTAKHRLSTVLRVTSGNFLEMFDFFLYGFYASYISRTFFPSDNEFVSLILTFGTFGAGFLMRPLGAIILAAIDRVGRRQGPS
jgi:MHS family citrate/tricarballylate:H+ symporter-like MFS transporter